MCCYYQFFMFQWCIGFMKLLFVFYHILLCLLAWPGHVTLKNRNRLQDIITVCSKIADTTLNDLTHLRKAPSVF